MRTVIRFDHATGDSYEIPADRLPPRRMKSHGVMPDIVEFQSPIDKSVITSRSQLREHEKRHSVRQCGELDKAEDYSANKPFRSVFDD